MDGQESWRPVGDRVLLWSLVEGRSRGAESRGASRWPSSNSVTIRIVR
jgi:hypothetical protein